MPRHCTICQHQDREAIDMALVRQEPAARIAAKHRVSADAVSRHFAAHLRQSLARAQVVAQCRVEQDHAHAIDVMAELKRCMERVNLVFDACDRWLRDPDNADDVSVIYTELVGDRPVHKRAKLSRLLAKLEDGGVDVDRGEIRHADPRDLILKTHDRLQATLELLAKLVGDLDERPQINVLLAPEWLQVRSELLTALWPFPEARAAVAARLQAMKAA
jgi:hypothetical protein